MTQDVTLQNTSTHVAQATVNGSHAASFAVANAETVGTTLGVTGLTTATGGIGTPSTGGINNSGTAPTTNIDNSATGGINNIGNATSTTNVIGLTNINTPSTAGIVTATTNIDAGPGQEGVINIGNNGGAIPADSSTTNIAGAVNVSGAVNFTGTVTLPSGSVNSSSLGLAKNDIFIGDATSANADTAMMTQDVTLQNTSTHVAQATVNGSHAASFAVANAMTVGGDATFNGAGTGLTVTNASTLTGAVTATNASNNIAGAFNGTVGAGTPNTGVFTTLTGSGNTSLDASPSSGGTVVIGNTAGPSTTTVNGSVNFTGTVTLPAGSVSSTSLGLAKNDIFIGDATSANADTAMMTQDVTLQNTSTHVAQATVNGSHATTFTATGAVSVTGLTTATGGISVPSTTGINNSSVVNTVVASTTNIDATTGAEGVINIGNAGGTTPLDSSTTNINGALNITGTVNFTNTPKRPLTTNDLFVGVSSFATPLATANGGMLNTSSTGVPSITATPTLGVAGPSGTTGSLSLANAGNANITTITVPSGAPAITYTLPSSAPGAGTFLEANTTTCGLTWGTPSNTGVNGTVGNAASDNTLTIAGTGSGPYTGAVTTILNLANPNTWTGLQTFSNTTSSGAAPLVATNTGAIAVPATIGYGATISNTASGSTVGNVGLQVDASGSTGYNVALYAHTGTINVQGLNASQLVLTDASRNLVSLGSAGSGTLLAGIASVPTFTSTPTLGVAGTTAGSLTLASGTGAFSTTFQTSGTAPTATYTYQLPAQTTTGPSAGQVLTAGTPVGTSPGPYTIPLSWANSGGEVFKAKSADVVLAASNTTLQVDPDLELSLVASATYEFSGVIAYDASGSGGTTAADLKIAMNFTVVPTSIRWSANQPGTAVSPTSVNTNTTAISDFRVDPVTLGNTQSVFVSGIIVVGTTGGTLEVEEAQNTSQTATTTVRANSFIRATRVQ